MKTALAVAIAILCFAISNHAHACVFVMTINHATPVYGNDRETQIAMLGVGDAVCVLELDGPWMATHYAFGNREHGGWIFTDHVRPNARPAE